jgi:preprotein translocase subunit SecF
MMRLIPETSIPFVARRYVFFVLSAILMLASVGGVVVRKGFNYGVDFTGGSLVQVHFTQRVSADAVRAALSAMGEGGAGIQQDEVGDFLIRVKAREFAGGETFTATLNRQLKTSFPGNDFEFLREETVGPQVSRELQGKVLLAVVIGLLGILIYVSFRFNLQFGVGAVLSLVHDTLITLGLVSLFNREVTVSTIAAVLTMIGFSVNDSIVVADRIREDLRKWRTDKQFSKDLGRLDMFMAVCNSAMNKTLSRTVLTSLTVFLVSLALLVFGASGIKDFAFVMTVGTIVGTYSSIFIVANFAIEWEKVFPSKRRR